MSHRSGAMGCLLDTDGEALLYESQEWCYGMSFGY